MAHPEDKRESVFNALYEHYFKSALVIAEGYPNSVTDAQLKLIRALASTYGDAGLISGDQGVIIGYALEAIGVYDDDRPSLRVVK